MNEKTKNALVPKSPSGIEKATSSAKRILSGMVGDTLALASKQGLTPEIGKCDMLVVEDEESLRLFLLTYIRKRIPNVRIMTARDGVEGYELASKFRPRIVWTCAKMPRMGGLEMIELIRHNPDLQNTKIILCTAWSTIKDVRARAFQLEVDEFVASPFRVDEPYSAINGCLAKVGSDPIGKVKGQQEERPTQGVAEAMEEIIFYCETHYQQGIKMFSSKADFYAFLESEVKFHAKLSGLDFEKAKKAYLFWAKYYHFAEYDKLS